MRLVYKTRFSPPPSPYVDSPLGSVIAIRDGEILPIGFDEIVG